ncbi:MAG: 2-succinyl-5-enolpyruvyl-6-hydroxy-3-cyclohexene-1-carboxylic-acid synthase [Chlamydiia bacterium]|nr:2-succinyl-5-enolpyruvyl-6-hydroxy-3-cyclohexene-1-carboxylic-acid synthase [Chlamydiia bacterium]
MKTTQVAEWIEEMLRCGVEEFSLCPGARNAELCQALFASSVKTYNWYEERSAAFFALGRAKVTGNPVAVVTTSGTAAAEILPACIEAYYTGVPLLLVTADRPRRYRGSGAPQSIEQVGLFSPYVSWEADVEGEPFSLKGWDQRFPAHLNLCFEEPNNEVADFSIPEVRPKQEFSVPAPEMPNCQRPLVIVGALSSADRESVARFLARWQAPIYLEAPSGLREDPRLQQLRVFRPEKGQVDHVLRIGGVPTHRFWRDLEEKEIPVTVWSRLPFSGLSWCKSAPVDLNALPACEPVQTDWEWIGKESCWNERETLRFFECPQEESSLIFSLSRIIPEGSLVYLGNSLPIREWDKAAVNQDKKFEISCNRGANGIDGQLSTFFGECQPARENIALVGDLTALYDLAAFWVIPQLQHVSFRVIVINNGGGKIFRPMFPCQEMQNPHTLSFEGVATLWNLQYEKWHTIPTKLSGQLIELIPE